MPLRATRCGIKFFTNSIHYSWPRIRICSCVYFVRESWPLNLQIGSLLATSSTSFTYFFNYRPGKNQKVWKMTINEWEIVSCEHPFDDQTTYIGMRKNSRVIVGSLYYWWEMPSAYPRETQDSAWWWFVSQLFCSNFCSYPLLSYRTISRSLRGIINFIRYLYGNENQNCISVLKFPGSKTYCVFYDERINFFSPRTVTRWLGMILCTVWKCSST